MDKVTRTSAELEGLKSEITRDTAITQSDNRGGSGRLTDCDHVLCTIQRRRERTVVRVEELSAREMEMFWKKVIVGSMVGGAIVVAGPPGIAALLRWIADGGAAGAPAYAH